VVPPASGKKEFDLKHVLSKTGKLRPWEKITRPHLEGVKNRNSFFMGLDLFASFLNQVKNEEPRRL
jgi:hypothetical protein